MLRERPLQAEAFLTHQTRVRLFAGVEPDVPGQLAGCYEPFTARGAGVVPQPKVPIHVGFQIVRSEKRTLALLAGIRFDVRVGS